MTKNYNIILGDVDFDKLVTDDDFCKEARRLLPDVMPKIAEKVGVEAWEAVQRALMNRHATVSSASDKFEVMRKASAEFQSSPKNRQYIEEQIVAQLKDQKEKNKRMAR